MVFVEASCSHSQTQSTRSTNDRQRFYSLRMPFASVEITGIRFCIFAIFLSNLAYQCSAAVLRPSKPLLPPLSGKASTDSREIFPQNDTSGLLLNSVELRKKALTFGQSVDERRKVSRILAEVDDIMSQRLAAENSANETLDQRYQRLLQTSQSDEAGDANAAKGEQRRQFRIKPNLPNYYKEKPVKHVPGRFLDEDEDNPPSPEQGGNYFEGDIVLWSSQAESLLEDVRHENDRRRKRKFIRSKVRRWDPRYPIEYSFDGSHSDKEQRVIELALEHWQNITCLSFVRRDDPPKGNRIVFTDVDGCASNVGRHPLGEPQFVSIAQECLRLGVIAHEVAHALGFWHEQSRPDRDNFVTVLWNNIEWGSAGQFTKEMPDDVDNGNIQYDYGSIMHYRSKAFSRSDSLYTIQTNIGDYQKTIGQRDQLSFNDIKLMNEMYCMDSCPEQLPCMRGGYTDPRKCDRCRCPDGFTGKLCDKLMPGYGANCGGEISVDDNWSFIASPGYPTNYKEGQECSWLVTAPPGQYVQLEYVGTFDLYCKAKHSLCMDYVEIRNGSDFSNTGMRYCCYSLPAEVVFSDTNEMLVLFRSFYRTGKGFNARVKAVAPTGTWGDWDPWSECTASCGGCGVRMRYRKCATGGVCQGDSRQVEPCNQAPCQYCAVPKSVVVPCGLWGLFRCEKITSDMIPCNQQNQCCDGFDLINEICVPRV